MPAALRAIHVIHAFLALPSARLPHCAMKYVVMERDSHFLATTVMPMMEMAAVVHVKSKLGSSAQGDLQAQRTSVARLFQRLSVFHRVDSLTNGEESFSISE